MSNALRMVLSVSKKDLLKQEAAEKGTREKKPNKETGVLIHTSQIIETDPLFLPARTRTAHFPKLGQ
jgi:hypothetical protein